MNLQELYSNTSNPLIGMMGQALNTVDPALAQEYVAVSEPYQKKVEEIMKKAAQKYLSTEHTYDLKVADVIIKPKAQPTATL